MTVGALYDLGREDALALPNGASRSSFILNTRDLLQPGASDFVAVGPGSQVWFLGYSIRVIPTGGTPTLPLQFFAELQGTFAVGAPYFFSTIQRVSLPAYALFIPVHYEGRFRVETPAALLRFTNACGVECEVSFQVWGKAL